MTEYPKSEGTHKDHWDCLPALHWTTQKPDYVSKSIVQNLPEFQQHLRAMPIAQGNLFHAQPPLM